MAHEVAHQWWYGVVGVDEYAAPWLNEGFASYTQARNSARPAACASRRAGRSRATGSGSGWTTGRAGRTSSGGGLRPGACLLQDLPARSASRVRPAPAAVVRPEPLRNGTSAAFQRLAQAASRRDLSAFWKRHRLP